MNKGKLCVAFSKTHIVYMVKDQEIPGNRCNHPRKVYYTNILYHPGTCILYKYFVVK